MITFRKIAAASKGELLRAYFTEHTPEPAGALHERLGRREPDAGGRLTTYYTSRDTRASWRQDMPAAVAGALGIRGWSPPRDAELDRLFEAKRADTGEAWSRHERTVSAYDVTFSPHKSVTLAAEFAPTAAEAAAIRHAVFRANDAAMRYIGRELGWARKGPGGMDGADPGAVGWASFFHHTARPTLPVQDGPGGATYLADAPVGGDPFDHIHNALFNVVVTQDGRIGSLDTQRLHARVHEFGAYGQAVLADELRRLGIRVGYDANGQAVVVAAVPQRASDAFSKSRHHVLRGAKAFAARQGLDWEQLSARRKFGILREAAVTERLDKNGGKSDRELWREQAAAIGWQHGTVLDEVEHRPLPEAERLEGAYAFAARSLAAAFETTAVLDHDQLRVHAALGLIGTGIEGPGDIDRVVALLEERGLVVRGERVALVVGMTDAKVRVTHTAQVRIETALADQARRAALDRRGALSGAAIAAAVRASGLDLASNPEHGAAQRSAIHALGQGGALTLLTGVAGSGKTTLLRPLVAAWQADRRFNETGREVVGLAVAWRQADALKEAGITRTLALQPMLDAITKGEFQPDRNTVLVIDEVSQVGPRAMLALLELQARTGMTIKALGDREQVQAIEAGDTIEILRRVLPKESLPELLTTVRQEAARDRTIAGLFRGTSLHPFASPAERKQHRLAEVTRALAMKREDGTAMLAGGDYDQVVGRIADLYLQRRDHLRAAGLGKEVTITALTNEDAAAISRAVRTRLKQRGEIAAGEVVYKTVDQRGETYDLPIAVGDRVRLFRRTWARIGGQGGSIGNNGDIVEVVGHTQAGLTLRARDGRVGEVEWRRMLDGRTGRLLLGFGHAMTVDAAQGITADEHINALPRGSAGATGFKAYVAESRSRGRTWTVVSEVAVYEAERRSRALGDIAPVTAEDLWTRVAADLSAKPYKPLGMDVAPDRGEDATLDFILGCHRHEMARLADPGYGRRLRERLEEQAAIAALEPHMPGLLALQRQLAAQSYAGIWVTP